MSQSVLSAIEPHDVPPLMALYTEPALRRFLGGPVDPVTASRRVEALLDAPSSRPAWTIRTCVGGPALGLVQLDDHHDGEDVEISCMVLPVHQGLGHGTRAVRDGIRFAFQRLNLRRLVAETQSANVASVRLLERVGMTFERRVVRFGAQQSIFGLARGE